MQKIIFKDTENTARHKKKLNGESFFINYLDKVDMHFIEVIVEFD